MNEELIRVFSYNLEEKVNKNENVKEHVERVQPEISAEFFLIFSPGKCQLQEKDKKRDVNEPVKVVLRVEVS